MAENVKKNSTTMSSSTLRYLPIAELHDDMVILKDGSVRGILEVTSINFSLKSEQEQNAIIFSYQNFLNSLEFPIQIYIRSKRLELDDYIANLSEVAEKQENALLKNQTQDYVQFISKLIEYADIMEKRFYIVVPYDSTFGNVKKGMFKLFIDSINPDDSVGKYKTRLKDFASMKKGLLQRLNIIQNGLENCSLASKILNTKELIQLFYNIYNPITAMDVKLKEVQLQDTKVKGK